MADILIKGLELPKKGEYAYNLQINSNGIVEGFQQKGVMIVRMKATAIELPSHGRLVSEDEIIRRFEVLRKSEHELAQNLAEHQHVDMSVDMLIEMIKKVPTIVEANNG